MKPTPGPWEVENFAEGYTKEQFLEFVGTCWDMAVAHGETAPPIKIRSGEDDGVTICLFGNGPSGKANAALVAAAPDLRDGLREVMEWVDNWDPNFTLDPMWLHVRTEIRNVLARADRRKER